MCVKALNCSGKYLGRVIDKGTATEAEKILQFRQFRHLKLRHVVIITRSRISLISSVFNIKGENYTLIAFNSPKNFYLIEQSIYMFACLYDFSYTNMQQKSASVRKEIMNIFDETTLTKST